MGVCIGGAIMMKKQKPLDRIIAEYYLPESGEIFVIDEELRTYKPVGLDAVINPFRSNARFTLYTEDYSFVEYLVDNAKLMRYRK